MATITTAIIPPAIFLPYIGPDNTMDTWQSSIPRGEILFRVDDDAVLISGVGDNQLLTITASLPRGFAYVLAEANMKIQNADVDAWQDGCQFRLQDSIAAARWNSNSRFESGALVINNATAVFNKNYDLVRPPLQKLIVCDRGDAGRLSVSCMNLTTNQAAGTVTFLARFYQFDLNQAFFWAVNMAFPVR